MQSPAELLKKHMLLLHSGLPAVSPSSHSRGYIRSAHTSEAELLILELLLRGIGKCQCSLSLHTQTSQSTDKDKNKRSIPSRGTLEFLALSRSSEVSLLTAVPLLVLRSTLNARFNLLKERLLTDERSKFLTAEGKTWHFIQSYILTCLDMSAAATS